MLELKKVKYHEDMSEETPCFSAEIWQDNRFMAHVKNTGHGGSNDLTPANGLTYKDIVHLDNLDAECTIFKLLDQELVRKQYQSKGFVLLKDDKTYIQKFSIPLRKMKVYPTYNMWIAQEKKSLTKLGYKILNTNL